MDTARRGQKKVQILDSLFEGFSFYISAIDSVQSSNEIVFLTRQALSHKLNELGMSLLESLSRTTILQVRDKMCDIRNKDIIYVYGSNDLNYINLYNDGNYAGLEEHTGVWDT